MNFFQRNPLVLLVLLISSPCVFLVSAPKLLASTAWERYGWARSCAPRRLPPRAPGMPR